MALEKAGENLPMVRSDSLYFNVEMFSHVQRVATMFASSTMVPDHFQKNIPNCVIALNLADRMVIDPFMLMQNMYIVHGNPGIEAKLAIALTNGCGRFDPLQFKHINKGEGDKWGCIAYAKDLKSGKVLESVTVDIEMAKGEGWYQKSGSKWKTMPELMLEYRSAMFFARVYCPEVLLGLKSREEIYDIVDLERGQNGTYGSPEEAKESKEKPNYAAQELKDKLEAGDKGIEGYRHTPEQADKLIDKIRTGQAELEAKREQDEQPSEPSLFDRLNNARSQFKGMAINKAEEVKKMPAEEQSTLSDKWLRLCPDDPIPWAPVTKTEEPAIEIPPFEQEPKYDANGRLEFISQMRKYKAQNDDIYARVLMDNDWANMNSVKPGDEKVALGFMAEEFKSFVRAECEDSHIDISSVDK